MLYPLKFEPIPMPKIWGGQKLKRLYNTDEYDNIGESWLVSAIAGNESIVKSGFLKDNSLSELVEVYLNEHYSVENQAEIDKAYEDAPKAE